MVFKFISLSKFQKIIKNITPIFNHGDYMKHGKQKTLTKVFVEL